MTIPPPPPSYPRPTEDEPVPSLDPETVEDDDELALAVDALVHRNYQGRVRQWEVAQLYEVVRQGVDAETWRFVLRIEELTNARWADLSVELVREAWRAGQKFALPKSETSKVTSEE